MELQPSPEGRSSRWPWIAAGAVVVALGAVGVVIVLRWPDAPVTPASVGVAVPAASSVAAPTFAMRGAFDLFVASGSVNMTPGAACTGSGAYAEVAPGAPVKVFDGSGKLLATGALSNARYESNPIGSACVFDLTVKDVPDGYSSYSVEIANQGSQQVASSAAHSWVFLHVGP